MKRIDLFEKTNRKKLLSIGGIALAAFLAVALILGIIQGLSEGGGWSLWSTYRYDDEGYEIGSGTVPSAQLRSLDVDWIDGEVEIVLCNDAYLSITETCAKSLSENAKLRWSLSEDGRNFSVKYRKSTAFLGFGEGGDDKKLVLRVPASMGLESVSVCAKSADVRVEGVSAERIAVTTDTGSIALSDGSYAELSLTSTVGDLLASPVRAEHITLSAERGDAELALSADLGFLIRVDAKSFVCDRTLTETAEGYLLGDGALSVNASAKNGAVRVNTKK